MRSRYLLTVYTLPLIMGVNMYLVPELWAHDEENHGEGPNVFSVHDTNRDGHIDRQEYDAFVRMHQQHRPEGEGERRRQGLMTFDELDSNADDAISEDEMVIQLNRRLQERKRIRYRGGRTE